MRNALGVLALVGAVSAAGLCAREAPGIPVGSPAQNLEGKWITSDGKEPDLKGKVYLVDFWFEN